MRLALSLLIAGLITAGFGIQLQAEEPTKKGPARILMVTQSAGFKHGSVTRKESELSPSERAITELGVSSNLFRVDCTQNAEEAVTKERLQEYDIVFFYTTGTLPIKEADRDYLFKEWVKQKGKGFIGTHSAADTYHDYPPYYEMIGGTFNGHPWNAGDTVTITVHDTNHPVSKPWGSEFTIKDEIYQFKNWKPENVRVLMSLNMEKTSLKKPYHVPIAWVKEYGEGRVMHMSLGHNESVWANPVYMESILGGIKWILHQEEGDATPNPEVSMKEEANAKAATEAAEKK